MIKLYFKTTFIYGLVRGYYYNNDKSICNNDKFFLILATALMNPVFIINSIRHDKKNINLYLEDKKNTKKDWFDNSNTYNNHH